MIHGRAACDEWQLLLDYVMRSGQHVVARHQNTVEIVGHCSHINMTRPVVTVQERVTGNFAKFLPSEAYWMLTGSSLLSGLSRVAPSYKNYSDNGYTLQGAYGPRILEQLSYVIDCLVDDKHSRQAVMEIWRPNPRKSADIPCTLSFQFLIRNNQLHMLVTMRSSDAWLGWPYDVFSFSMVAAWVMLWLRFRGVLQQHSTLGTMKLTAGSQHIYEKNLEKAANAAQSKEYWAYKPMSLSDFNHPDELVVHLGHLARGQYKLCKSSFLAELKNLKQHEV